MIFKRFYCFAVTFLLLISYAVAQNKLKGYIKDSLLHTPVENVMVTLHDTAMQKTLAYGLSDHNGYFEMNTSGIVFPIVLQVKALNYATYKKSIYASSTPIVISLLHQITEIKEVTVKSGPITKRGDTINYRVDAFAQINDRSIADVIARMPGIEIGPDGKIYYLGKPIDKYYIEGLDLLEGKYNLANKNLPNDAVSSVQILENHQPLKILDSIAPSEKTSLNIKLKKNITATGTVYALAGLAPFLYDENITPMLFKKNEQIIASYQLNNSGNDASQQLNTLSIEELTNQLNDKDEPATPLNIIGLPKPAINSRQYLFNRLQMPTLQYLKKLNNGMEVKFGISYINDKQIQTGNNTTIYPVGNGNVVLNEQIDNSYTTHHIENSLIIQKNSKNIFYKNTTRIKGDWNQQNGQILASGQSIQQNTNNNFLAISNNFKTILPIGKQLVSFHSIINYHQDPNILAVIPGVYSSLLNNNMAYQKTTQNFTQYYFKTQQASELIKQLKKYTLTLRAGLNTQYQQTNGFIVADDSLLLPLPYKNNLNTQSVHAYILQEWNKKIKQGNVGIKLPIQYMQVNVKDAIQSVHHQTNLFTLNPELYVRYDINNTWRWNSNIGYQQKIDNYLNITYGYVLKNYRNIQANPYPLAVIRSYNASTALLYRSTLHASFFHLLYTYSQIKQPYVLNTTIDPNGSQQVTALAINNTLHEHLLNIRYSKMINHWHSNVAISTDISMRQFKQYINQTLTPTKNWFIKTNFIYNGDFAKWGSFDYQISPQWLILSINNENAQPTFLYAQSFKYTNTLLPSLSIMVQQEHYYNGRSVNHPHTFFTDVLIRKQLKNKTDIEWGIRNLINNNYIVTTTINPYYTLQSGMKFGQDNLL